MKHYLTLLVYILIQTCCNSLFSQDKLTIMTPFFSETGKGYIIVFANKNSQNILFADNIKTSIEKGRIKFTYSNARSINTDDDGRVSCFIMKEYILSLPNNYKIIIDGKTFPKDKINEYLSDPQNYKPDELEKEIEQKPADKITNKNDGKMKNPEVKQERE